MTKDDIVALGYRKKQLGVFSQLLSDPEFFELCKKQKSIKGDEPLWQAYFEKNPWVFGYGLSYFYVTGFEERKLEQFVQGYDLLNRGKPSRCSPEDQRDHQLSLLRGNQAPQHQTA
ncbi:MAG: hypothetical protein V9G23_03830 [Giesbergeria sp.]